MVDSEFLRGLTTERSKRVYLALCRVAQGELNTIAQSEVIANGGTENLLQARYQIANMHCQLHRDAVLSAIQTELEEVKIKATVSTMAVGIEKGIEGYDD